MAAAMSLRELKKDRTRELLARVAIELFEEHGFDAVTVDQIVAKAEVSPRTFFRYFGSKEAVLFSDQAAVLDILRDAIEARPSEEPPLLALRRSLVSVTALLAENREQHLRTARISLSGANIAAYQRAVVLPNWEEVLAQALATRLGVSLEQDLRPRLLAGTAIALMSSVTARWIAEDGSDPEALLGEAFDLLGDAAQDAATARVIQ